MKDYIVRATAADDQIRAFAITSRGLVEEARTRHNTSPVATAALGRLLSAGAMMGAMMKGDQDLLTLQIKCSGPIQGLTVTADAKGNVKGFVENPEVMLPVIKDMGLKEPYSGQTELKTGEIAEDLTYYFANSEQVPSSVGLGVLMDKDNTVRQAGGFIIQLMPFVEDGVVDKLEQKLNSIDSVTSYLDRGFTPEQLLTEILGEFGLEIHDKMDAQFHCNCSRERVEKALISVGRKNLNEMVQDGKPIEVKCHFCNTPYTFDVEDLKNMIKRSK